MRFVLAAVAAAFVASAPASAALVVIQGPLVTGSFGLVQREFWKGEYAPVYVRLLSFDVTALVDGRVTDRFGSFDVAMQAGEARTILANLDISHPWYYSSVNFVTPEHVHHAARFENITFDVSDEYYRAVPEPATWAMLITGFCAAGASVRFRRKDRVQPIRAA